MSNKPDEQTVPSGDEEMENISSETSSSMDEQASSGDTPSKAGGRNLWFVPDDALSDEQIESMQAEGDDVSPQSSLPGTAPEHEGDWYTPPDAVTVGDTDEVLDEVFVGGIQPAADGVPDVFDEEPEMEEGVREEARQAPEGIAAQEREVPQAPVGFGQGDFRQAPEAPIEDTGEEGVRREQPTGLDPQQARRPESFSAELPSRGFGGTQGGDHEPSGDEESQVTRALSDTGQLTEQPIEQGGEQPPSQQIPQSPHQPSQPAPETPQAQQPQQGQTMQGQQGQQPPPPQGRPQPPRPPQQGQYRQPQRQGGQQQGQQPQRQGQQGGLGQYRPTLRNRPAYNPEQGSGSGLRRGRDSRRGDDRDIYYDDAEGGDFGDALGDLFG